MPYIGQGARLHLEPALRELFKTSLGLGDINYVITKAILNYLEAMGRNYHSYASVVGMLDTIKNELYRREINGYEEEKCMQNGDVY